MGLRAGAGPPGVAPRVLGHGAAPAGRTADRPARRRRRPGVPAPRERDRPERGRHAAAVLAVLGARRAPAHRRREDVEVARQPVQRAGPRQAGPPPVGAALPVHLDALPQAAEVLLGQPAAGRGGRSAPGRLPCAPGQHPGRRRAPGHAGAGRAGARRVRRDARAGPEHGGRARRGVRPGPGAQHGDRRRRGGRGGRRDRSGRGSTTSIASSACSRSGAPRMPRPGWPPGTSSG